MKKKVIGLILVLAICLGLTGCVEGEQIENTGKTEYSILLNEESCFVYTFKDEKPECGIFQHPEALRQD